MTRGQVWASAIGVALVLVFTVAVMLGISGEGASTAPRDRVAELCARAFGIGHTDEVARCIARVDR